MDSKLFQTVFDSSPTPSALIDVDDPTFTIINVNKAFLINSFLGKKELIGMGITEAFPQLKDDSIGPENLEKSLNKVVREKTIDEMPIVKYDIINKQTGEIDERYWEASNTPIFSENGELVCILHQVREVTAYVKMQINKELDRVLLDEIEQKFLSVFNHSATGIAMLDLEGKWIEVNPKICEITGYSRKELFELTFKDLTHPEDLEKDLDHVTKLLSGEVENYKIQKRYLKKNGDIIWAWLNVSLIKKGNGEPYHFVSHILDITDSKLNEIALRQSEERYDSLFFHHPDAVFSFDNEGRLINANAVAADMAEGSLEDILSIDFFTLLPKYEKERVYKFFLKAKNGEKLHYNTNFITFKGTPRILNITHLPIFRNDEIIGVFGIAKDVTENEQVRAQQLQSQERLEKVYSRSVDVICAMDVDGNFQEVSQASQKMWGYTPEELIGHPYMNMVHPEDRELTQAASKIIMAGTDVTAFQNRYIRKDGSIMTVIWSAHFDPEEKMMFCVARDGQEKMEAEYMLRYNEDRFRKLVQDGSDLIAILDYQAHYTYVSPTSYSVLGILPEVFIGRSAFEFIHPDDAEIVGEYFGKLATEKRLSLPPFRFQNLQGQWRWMETEVTNLLEDSTINGIVANSRDITERIEADFTLQQTAEKYFTLFNSSPLPQWIYDIKTLRFLDVNHATVDFYGYSAEEFQGMTLRDIRPEAEVEKMLATHHELLHKTTTHRFGVFTHKKRNGELAKMEIFGYALNYQNIPSKMVIAIDVTKREEALEQLKDRETKLLEAQKLAKLGYWYLDLETKIIDWSEEVYNIFGISKDIIITEDYFWSLIPHTHKDKYIPIIEDCIENEGSYEFDHSIELPDNTIKWVREHGTYKRNLDGQWGLSGTVQDITADRLARELIIKSESRYRGIVESHTSYVIRTDLEGKYTFCNEKYQNTFSWFYLDENLIGKDASESIMPYHLEKVQNTVAQCVNFTNEPFKIEIDKISENGYPMTSIWEFMALTDYSGNITEIQCVGIDITERKKAEMEIIASNQRYGLVTKATSDAIWDWDLVENKIFRSSGFKGMFGFTDAEIEKGNNFWNNRIHTKDFQALNDSLFNFINYSDDNNWEAEYRFYNAQDEILYVRDRAVAIRNDIGKAIRLVGAIQNITADKIKEKEDRLKLSLTNIFAQDVSVENIFHDSLNKLMEFTELDYGEIWITNMDNTRLGLMSYNGVLETSPTNYKTAFKGDEGLPGLVYSSGDVIIMDGLDLQSKFIRQEFILLNNFRSAIGYPIKFEKEIIGVICLFQKGSNEPLNNHPRISESTLHLLALDLKRKKAELDLNLFFDLSPDLLCIANLQGYFKKANMSLSDLLGYDFEEIKEINFLDIIHPEDIEKTKNTLSDLELGKTVHNFENRYIKKDKSVIWLSWTATPLRGEEHIFAIARDITDRKNYELELEASSKRVTDTLESIQDGFYALDKNYVITFWNKKAEELLHQTKEEMEGSYLWEYFPEAKELTFYKAYKKVFESGESVRFEEFFPPLNMWFGVSVFPAEEGITVYFKDITKEKIAERELLKFKKVIENSQEAIGIINLSPKSIYLNPTFQKELGMKPKELEEYGEQNLYSDPKIGHKIFEDLYAGRFLKEEVELLTKAGNILHYTLSAGPVYDDNGDLMAIYGIHADIRERIKNEQRLKDLNSKLETHARELALSNAELEQFAYVASHDLQEPLRMVTSFLTQLERKYNDLLDEKGKKYIYFAVDGAKRMRQIILDLLEFSRVGRMEDKYEEVNLNDIIKEIKNLHRQQISEKKAKIISDILPTIKLPKAPIRQVFHNLINNGLKYQNDDNTPLIQITVNESADFYEFAFQDNGIGFRPEYQDKIFIIFQRLHQREEYPGTGMGLAVTKKIIENLNGNIWVKTENGKGSTFFFTLPK